MFNLFGGAEFVEPLGVKDSLLTFRSSKKNVKVGKNHSIRLKFLINENEEVFKVEVYVASVRPLAEGGSIVVGRLLLEPRSLMTLVKLVENNLKQVMEDAERRSKRLPVGIRVLSQDLPGYRAITVDISRHGAQILADGELETGTYFNITLELDGFSVSQLAMQAVVVWTKPQGERGRRYLLGLEWTEQHPKVEALWLKYYQQTLQRSSSSVMQRTISGEDVLP